MNNLIVIINPRMPVDLINAEKDAKESQSNTTGVKHISERVWLIDPHTSHTFFASLLHSAHGRGCETFVYEVLDTIQGHSPFPVTDLEPR